MAAPASNRSRPTPVSAELTPQLSLLDNGWRTERVFNLLKDCIALRCNNVGRIVRVDTFYVLSADDVSVHSLHVEIGGQSGQPNDIPQPQIPC